MFPVFLAGFEFLTVGILVIGKRIFLILPGELPGCQALDENNGVTQHSIGVCTERFVNIRKRTIRVGLFSYEPEITSY